MKKILFLFALIVATIAASAQLSPNDSLRASRALATLTNADTVNYVKKVPSTLSNGIVAVSFTVTRLSGTAAGSAAFQYSIDGSNWITDSTFTLSNAASQTFSFTKTSIPFSAYRVRLITSGTVTARGKGWLLYRKNY